MNPEQINKAYEEAIKEHISQLKFMEADLQRKSEDADMKRQLVSQIRNDLELKLYKKEITKWSTHSGAGGTGIPSANDSVATFHAYKSCARK